MSIEQQGKTKKVYVGVSGGVDSSVAAARLQEQGYDVTGVFIKIWHPDISACDWRAEMHDAMRVCAHLDIPFKMIDLSDVYVDKVVSYMVDAYKQGQTPNPDVMCNGFVKFGAFYEWARNEGADFVATGHYAQCVHEEGVYTLRAGIDASKDQTYFLWQIQKEQLPHILFPVGAYTKKEIREQATRFGLPTATKPDSQGLCFIGDVDVKSFLKKYITVESGDVLNQDGVVVGTHDGAVLYTLGERHGFDIATKEDAQKPHYVIAKDIEKNTITVSTELQSGEAQDTLVLRDTNWLTTELPTSVQAVYRYHGEQIDATLEVGTPMRVQLARPVTTAAPGQSVVLYDGNVCVGGGVIAE